MARTRPSMQDLIRDRRRRGFVGRGAERAAFRQNFDLPPEDERHRFLFHVHGNAGVGKTFLVRELEQIARACGALTAYVDDGVGSLPEAMAAISARFARQGHRFKDLDRLLATHRERSHEAESAAAAAATQTSELQPSAPSAASLTAARASLVGLGLVPGVGAFAGAVDPAQLAHGADRLRAGIGARLGSREDAQLVLSPERVLTPVLLDELAGVAAEAPWLVLIFDTYERTAPLLDGWLHDVMTTDRHGALPANVVVVTAGQRPLDTARWGGLADFVADVPLAPFTAAETRGLLADRGVVAEPVVEEVLRLTGGLPVLVSTLAESRPGAPDDIGDPSATAVERFLKWERDPVRRAAALACALPRGLDADVFRAAVDCPETEADALFGWLRSLPFVTDRGHRIQYHDVVRAPMLRLQRLRSPRGWAGRHTRLAETFGRWRTEAEAGLDAAEVWADGGWRELRLAESYHRLCANARTALPLVLRDFVDACDSVDGGVFAERWARVLAEAGEDADTELVRTWGHDLLAALADGGVAGALGLLLNRTGFEERWQARARVARGRALRHAGAYAPALAEFDRALALDPELARAYRGRGFSHGGLGDHEAGLADLDRADALEPDHAPTVSVRGEYHRILGHYDRALEDLDRGIALDPSHHFAWASRGAVRQLLGQPDEALADLNHALELKPEYPWALIRRARVWRTRGEHGRQLADLDEAVRLYPDGIWGLCERGDALRAAGRPEQALADYDRALALDDGYASAYASRGVCRGALGRPEEALADLDRALALQPDYPWALRRRAELHLERASHDRALADLDRARALRPDEAPILVCRVRALLGLGRFEEARADLDRALELSSDTERARLAPLGEWIAAENTAERRS
ncbi:tetratricopeptide repeat protein [Streptomyces mirabilis]|uniref:tetratricopeptide repeat protein n=1 Tax=Streptomyces mirabilis TaxID=68239 RepID=UPI00224D3C78|nr:tetratricopeptide repeat protein [Streptomyces mirabilis]MCX4434639.1 tetratricopeptide repeat protein [Streptomyces mirabilis]